MVDPLVAVDAKGMIGTVNQATLDLYKVKSKEEYIQNLSRTQSSTSYENFIEVIIALAEGRTKFTTETINRTFVFVQLCQQLIQLRAIRCLHNLLVH